MTSRPCVPTIVGFHSPVLLLQKPSLFNYKCQTSIPQTTSRPATRRLSSHMTLPSPSDVSAAKFPKTVEQASKIFQSAAQSGSLEAPHLPLLSILASHPHGARGLFVALLSDPNVSLADSEPIDPTFITMLATTDGELGDEEAAKSNLKSHGEYIRSLAIKNVVMPTATAWQYSKDSKPDLMEASEITRDRAIRLARAWHSEDESRKRAGLGSLTVCDTARDMRKALEGHGGIYESFVQKWGYGEAQCSAMVAALRQVFGSELD